MTQRHPKVCQLRPQSLRQGWRQLQSQRQGIMGRRRGRVETSQRLTQRGKGKGKDLKLRRMPRQSQRPSPSPVAKLPFLVSFGPKGHVTGGELSVSSWAQIQASSEAKGGCTSKCEGNSCSSCCNRWCFRSITCMQVLKSSIRAFVRPFVALVSIISSCIGACTNCNTAWWMFVFAMSLCTGCVASWSTCIDCTTKSTWSRFFGVDRRLRCWPRSCIPSCFQWPRHSK